MVRTIYFSRITLLGEGSSQPSSGNVDPPFGPGSASTAANASAGPSLPAGNLISPTDVMMAMAGGRAYIGSGYCNRENG
ncbi:hypothetical protein Q3G72_022587 [Acer saccharum]|nr:hypothetical protein Q3G72_022587 [Acer saccharum]